MSSRTPVLLPISAYSQGLHNLLTTSFVELEKKPVDRITSALWEQNMLSIIDQHIYMAPIKTWLQRSISMDVKTLSKSELLQFFVGNQLLQRYKPEDALKYLKQLQHILDKMQFGTNKPQHHQLNFLEDITQQDFLPHEDSDSGDDNDEDDSDYEDLDSGSSTFQPQSPPRKRQKKSSQTTNQLEITPPINPSEPSITFEAFNNMPILSRNENIWTQILQANPSFWKLKCLSWTALLEEAYALRKDTALTQERNEEQYQNVVGVLREIRKVRSSLYSRADWQEAVKQKEMVSNANVRNSPTASFFVSDPELKVYKLL
ncbi:hypothetical protein GALMADRAFT_148837 [Galerina marginata CBS 339.88]|uniref:Uncharacterized protein n=1 Tax=Galerina marginata (strain CBS 339.88) TaxID=685588 RepID=A0A067S387_GALM3|nr:hypothetical protein GALMADRAFT_148837 [Galerina marginata CBS 339.88]